MLVKEDSDEMKYEKISLKMDELGIEFYCESYRIINITENYVQGEVSLILNKNEGKETFELPFILENSKFSDKIIKVISEMKKFIIFEKLGIVVRFQEITRHPYEEKTERDLKGPVTENQMRLIYEKYSRQENRIVVDMKLKEFGKTIDNLTKAEASAIISCFGRK